MIDLKKHVSSIVAASEHQLSWAEPERWVQSELFQLLKAEEAQSGLEPLPMEIPYYTLVRSTGKESHEGPPYGKWVDLLVIDKERKSWEWVELKVAHLQNHKRPHDVLKPFVNDTASLLGFHLEATIAGWKSPPKKMRLTKVTPLLTEVLSHLRGAKHHFCSVLLVLHSENDLGLELSKLDFAKDTKKRIHGRGWGEYEQPPVSFRTSSEAVGRSRQGNVATMLAARWTL